MNDKPLFRLVLAALFTALIAVGSYIAIPFAPVPLVLANFFALLAGLMLGPLWGGVAALLYLVLGALGLPVFSGGSGGFGHFASPTGGFLLGYPLAAVTAGLVAHGPRGLRKSPGLVRLALAGLLSLIVLYAIGLPWFQVVLSAKFTTLWAAFLFMSPYLLGDLVKVTAAVILSRSLLPLLK